MNYLIAGLFIVAVVCLFLVEALGFWRWLRKKIKQAFCYHVDEWGFSSRSRHRIYGPRGRCIKCRKIF